MSSHCVHLFLVGGVHEGSDLVCDPMEVSTDKL